MKLAFQVAGDQWTSITTFMWILAITLLFVYGQRIQIHLALRRIWKDVKRLAKMSEEARRRLNQKFLEYGADELELKMKVDAMLNTFLIEPTRLDPRGVVYKLGELLKQYDKTFREKVFELAPKADKVARMNLTNLAEVAFALNYIHKVVRHYYISAKKFNDLLSIVQLQLQLPIIMEVAEAYYSSMDAFLKGVPIGDSLGPMVAAKLAGNSEFKEIEEDTAMAEAEYEGRKLVIVKARGPGGTVGRPGEAISKVFQLYNISAIITVDAGLKLYGEESGQVVDGVGAAVGGPGFDKFLIEEVSSNKGTPLYAVVVKMSEKEAVGEMNETIKKAVDKAVERVYKIIRERTKMGDVVLVAGIGNTIGVP